VNRMTENVKLSQRLATIAGFVPAGSRVADIGSDHALLPVFLCQIGRASYAVAGELNLGPYQAAKQQVDAAGLAGLIHVRQGNGLSVLKRGEVDTITIAGMGGSLIVRILTESQHLLEGVSRLVLQPNVAEDAVRRWLDEQGWYLSTEDILEEDGKIYEVLVGERRAGGAARSPQLYSPRKLKGCDITLDRELLLKLGPYLLEHPKEPFFLKWDSELNKTGMILNELSKSELASARLREGELRLEAQRIQEVLECLRRGKQ
jgi:tRNA (adenine22-N1)-methyltransferase